MENFIRDGELHLLMTESPCDVLISCKDQKLKAHKLILYIVSPVLQELLVEDTSETSVLIFPDVNGSTMSLVLSFIYNGNVTVPSHSLPEFLSVIALLKLHVDHDFETSVMSKKNNILQTSLFGKCENIYTQNHSNNEDYSIQNLKCDKLSKKNLRDVPNLMPIASLKNNANGIKRSLYNKVFPSPWCPRVVPLLAGPRENYTSLNDTSIPSTQNRSANDSNNNFKINSENNKCNEVVIVKENNLPEESNCKVILNCLKPTQLPSLSPAIPETNDEKLLTCKKLTTIYNNHTDNHNNSIKAEIIKEILSDDVKSNMFVNNKEEVCKKVIKVQSDEKQKPYKCDDCGKSFSQLRNYKYHRSIHEGTKEFSARCQECGKMFNDKGYLSSHMKIHRDRKEYACPNCPKRFNQRVAYNMHMRIHTGLKPHECPTCGKSFSRKMLLKQHQRVHTGERPYSCPECGKSFADRSNMSLHARLHSGVKPYACSLCPKSFTKKHHLKTHMNFHTGLKPYSCEKCGLAFSQSSNMRTHYKKCVLKSPETVSS
ncbi:hypothetical protein RN001_007994 [Aquatica leii]|uniref:Uncharacterized protein n=1 Tax=Aquatica leii TaxID=1421715 RepID=A0AAN7PA82_9COLE|nr:hypothetical protein RN001_007994 [Aquatica leii]